MTTRALAIGVALFAAGAIFGAEVTKLVVMRDLGHYASIALEKARASGGPLAVLVAGAQPPQPKIVRDYRDGRLVAERVRLPDGREIPVPPVAAPDAPEAPTSTSTTNIAHGG